MNNSERLDDRQERTELTIPGLVSVDDGRQAHGNEGSLVRLITGAASFGRRLPIHRGLGRR